MRYRSVSEIARVLGVRPRDISDLLYQRGLRDEQCPLVGGRRLIPDAVVPEIEQALLSRGKDETAKEEERGRRSS
jgi:hypothetical protein